ncbi:MAG: hypothetical protein E6G40_04885 [Actinobacteria bacterium]|nr:MAG: hypothetical protein E6G40_04885 [Actinomycetota bacterium]
MPTPQSPGAEQRTAMSQEAPSAPEAAPADVTGEEGQTRVFLGKLWSRKRAHELAHVAEVPTAEEAPARAAEPLPQPTAPTPDVPPPVAVAPLAEVTAEEADQPKEAKHRWRWARRAPLKEHDATAGEQIDASAPAPVEAPVREEPPKVPAPVLPEESPQLEAPVPPQEPPHVAAPAVEETPVEVPKPRLRKRPKSLPLEREPEERRKADLRKASERRATPPIAPIDLAPPKTYLPPPPPPEIPAVPAASVSPVAVEPAALGSAAPGTVAATPEAPLPESGAELPSPEDVWNRGETPEEFMSHQAAQWTSPPSAPQAAPQVAEPEEKKSGIFKRTKKPKVKVSNGFEYTVPPRGEKKGQPPTISVGPAPEARREINCPRCGQPSPRGLCEACEDALSQLRQLTVAFLDE